MIFPNLGAFQGVRVVLMLVAIIQVKAEDSRQSKINSLYFEQIQVLNAKDYSQQNKRTYSDIQLKSNVVKLAESIFSFNQENSVQQQRNQQTVYLEKKFKNREVQQISEKQKQRYNKLMQQMMLLQQNSTSPNNQTFVQNQTETQKQIQPSKQETSQVYTDQAITMFKELFEIFWLPTLMICCFISILWCMCKLNDRVEMNQRRSEAYKNLNV